MTHAAIARRLGCAPSTVATHLASVRETYTKAERPITKPTDYRDRLRTEPPVSADEGAIGRPGSGGGVAG
ncbi:hypothetical protein [Streptomyces sp. NPDC059979]|uniref:hypothetical protein n=1 Tax=unclassified Streptomyces TaxID=2593676 RepID=UPI003669F9EA